VSATPLPVPGPATGAVERWDPRLTRRRLYGSIFYGACLASIIVLLLTLFLILWDVLSQGLPWLDPQFVTGVPSRRPEQAGIFPALIGTIQVVVISGLLAFPVGVGAALYLAEYAGNSRVTRALRTNISNLSGVPSVIYGIFGLALFVRVFGFGFTVLSGALTLTLVILPVVIIASIEAIKAVPDAQREGAYALGASRWQMVRQAVVPAAAPGMMTGIILAMARAIGETAPLILVGAFTFVTFLPQPFEGGYTVLPIQVLDWATRPQADFHGLAAAAIIVILVLMLVLNGLAILVRARLSRHIQW
jgi:phosphate transport system permease protein